MSGLGTAGFFGKLPSRGDFVSRRLPREFLDVWDDWLQKSLASSRTQLGSEWLEVYLTSPVWCFSLSSAVCGDSAYAGVMIPSVDRVGRYFPFVAAMPHAEGDSTLRRAHELHSWYTRTEALLLEALDEPPLELDALDSRLADVASADAWPGTGVAWALPFNVTGEPARWHFAAPPGTDVAEHAASVLAGVPREDLGAYGVWWTAGSERVGASALITSGLPGPETFAAMLDGRWADHGWESAAPRAAVSPDGPPATRTAAVTDVGKKREVNEDAFACREEAGVWLVADGLGGHQAGDVASRMVASVVGQLSGPDDLERRTERLMDSLRVVNGCLQAFGEYQAKDTLVASTICALLLGPDAAACVWAGDSRIYRLRDGQLEQLTTDHAEGGSDVNERHGHEITRAVGGSDVLEPDVRYTDLAAGDRYLLCSDGLYGEVSAEELTHALSLNEPQAACDELMRLVLDGDAPDNLTGVAVFVEHAENEGAFDVSAVE
jgi:type VI secretion system protein ImpM